MVPRLYAILSHPGFTAIKQLFSQSPKLVPMVVINVSPSRYKKGKLYHKHFCFIVGIVVGVTVGFDVGNAVGTVVGFKDGDTVGLLLGNAEGTGVGQL
jgi:hypothetical protein